MCLKKIKLKKNMENLISMTDYVLKYNKIIRHNTMRIVRYANFLKKPLELWMFTPCDEENEPIIKRHYQYFDNDIEYDDYLKELEKATERCLFTGLEIGVIEHHIKKARNIEYLANFGTLKVTKTMSILFG
jgi:hypothetical protein